MQMGKYEEGGKRKEKTIKDNALRNIIGPYTREAKTEKEMALIYKEFAKNTK